MMMSLCALEVVYALNKRSGIEFAHHNLHNTADDLASFPGLP